ncbi:MAG: glycosyltransferase family 4 protein [Armatimonadetes bacterium]|nr:glycosyltransferase family 4 protein [Armatimonadota bacterium]
MTDGGGRTGTLASRRVVIVLNGLLLGGAERQAILLARYLRDHVGADVMVAAFGRPGSAAELCDRVGVRWKITPFAWEPGRWQRVRMLLAVARDLRALRPDILLPYTMHPNAVCGLIWKLTGARLCMWNQRDEGRQRVEPRWERMAIRRTPWFASNSTHGAEFVTCTLGAPKDRMRVILNGVEPPTPEEDRAQWRSRLGLPDDTSLATMAANLHGFKDHATLLNAWRIVQDRTGATGRQMALALAGRPENTGQALKAQAFDLDLGRSVRFLGPVRDVAGLFAASDCCAFSSQWEGVPNGILEGMAAGLPVVATDIPGIREAVGDARCALLAPPRDAEAMADGFLRVASDRDAARRMGDAGRERIATAFSPERMVRETGEWIEEGLRRHGR